MDQDETDVEKQDIPLLQEHDELLLRDREVTAYDSIISLITIIFLTIVPMLVSVTEFFVASYSSNVKCDVGAIVKLFVWLSIYGFLDFACSIFGLVICLTLTERLDRTKVMVVINGCIYLLMLVWNIVGSVALFSTSSGCKAESYSLWLTVFTSLILGWITIIAFIIVATYVLRLKN
jgi:hypothetical protein